MKRRRITRQDMAWRSWIVQGDFSEWKISRGTSLKWNAPKQDAK